MKEKRYFYGGELSIGSIARLEGEEFHHLANVMRTRIGDRVCLFNGDGYFYFGEVETISKKNAEIKIIENEKSNNEPTINLTVFQALAKGDKLSLIMQKITEIGATKLVLFESDFCDVKSSTGKAERLENISISAAKQCGRATVVEQNEIINIKEISSQISSFDAFYVAYEAEDGKTLAEEVIKNRKNLNNIAIMIGAEGGFSPDEIKLLKNNGAIIVSMGKRILRTETAAIVAVGLISQIMETIGEDK